MILNLVLVFPFFFHKKKRELFENFNFEKII